MLSGLGDYLAKPCEFQIFFDTVYQIREKSRRMYCCIKEMHLLPLGLYCSGYRCLLFGNIYKNRSIIEEIFLLSRV